MGNWWTGGTWLREYCGAKKCDGNEWLGMGSGRKVKCMMGYGARCGAKRGVGGGVEDDAVRGGVGWEEAKMACEITSDAILPI